LRGCPGARARRAGQWVTRPFLLRADRTRRGLQKKGVLSESALPEELRLALAQTMQNDLFYQVGAGVRIWDLGSVQVGKAGMRGEWLG
jgi:hypothetical protein